MIINKNYEIQSCDDAELHIKRTGKLEYRITYDDSKEMKAIVFVIGGHGVNNDIDFLDQTRHCLTSNFNVVTINVFYQCFSARPSMNFKYNPRIMPTDLDLHRFKVIMSELGINTEHINRSNYFDCVYDIDRQLDKNREYIKHDLSFFADIIPPNNEYQNYGIMAAIDHINALKDIVKRFPQFKNLPKIYGGGSYGGYLALMCAKIAPWYVDGVIDNSGEAVPILQCIIGRDMNMGEFVFNGKNIKMITFVKNFWTRKNENSPFFFSDEFYLIRNLLNSTHLLLQHQKNSNILLVSYHSNFDYLTFAKHKIQLMQILKQLNYDTTFHLIEEKDIDGKYIKNLDHGCGITDKALFKKELPLMLEKLKDKKFIIKEDSISYPCKNKVFTFKDEDDKFILEII
ncbi:DUF2920 family protein [Campylobacter jejuni]|nr:DUF2920 family protein [Campylobacter jejuni]